MKRIICISYIFLFTISISQCSETISPFQMSNTDKDTDKDLNTESAPDVDSEMSSSDTSSELAETDQNVLSTDTIQPWDSEMDTETADGADSGEISPCPGSCQYNAISSTDLEASGIAGGFYIDTEVSSYLLCLTKTGEFPTDLQGGIPVFNGWIRDNGFPCPNGEYCCRPKIATDVYCNETGGTCVPSVNPGEGAGYCAFASNACEKDN
jgi:hypothetical protein